MKYEIYKMTEEDFNNKSKIKLTFDNLRTHKLINKKGYPENNGLDFMHKLGVNIVVIDKPNELIDYLNKKDSEMRSFKMYKTGRSKGGSANFKKELIDELKNTGWSIKERVGVKLFRLPEGER
jgi:hypothetical protein